MCHFIWSCTLSLSTLWRHHSIAISRRMWWPERSESISGDSDHADVRESSSQDLMCDWENERLFFSGFWFFLFDTLFVLMFFSSLPFKADFKYDGLRCQIHRNGEGKIFIFSRNLENLTPLYPDVVSLFSPSSSFPSSSSSSLSPSSFILDSEIVAFDYSTNIILPFQVWLIFSLTLSHSPIFW